MKRSNGTCHPRSQFTSSEDRKLKAIVEKVGTENWNIVAKRMNSRNARQCRERWEKYLSPTIDRGEWTEEEDKLIEMKFLQYGSKWKILAKFFPNRTDVMIRNRWNMLKRKQQKNQKDINNNKVKIDATSIDNNQNEKQIESNQEQTKKENQNQKNNDILPQDSFQDINQMWALEYWINDPIFF